MKGPATCGKCGAPFEDPWLFVQGDPMCSAHCAAGRVAEIKEAKGAGEPKSRSVPHGPR